MSLSTKFSAMIPRDNRDLLVEDLENQSNAIHSAIGDRQDDVHPEFAGAVKSEVAGIVWGLGLSYSAGSDSIDVQPGVVFNRGRRGSIATVQSVPMSGISVGDYIVARIWFEDVDLRTNPVTHINEPVYRLYHCTIEVKLFGDIDGDDVVIGRVVDIDSSVPVFGVAAVWEYEFGGNRIRLLPRTGAGQDVFGPLGNKYFVRFGVLPDTPISVQKFKDSSGIGFTYLNVQLQGDSSGVTISTLQQIIDAINTTPEFFRAELVSGSGDFVPTLLPNLYASYSQFSGGIDYRNYYETITGSRSLSVLDRYNTSDPYTKHISHKGRGIPTERNPHGLTLEDMGVAELSTEEHIKRDHFPASTIPRSVGASFLRTETPSANELKINRSLGVDDVGLIQGRVLKVASDLIVNAPSDRQELYEFFLTQGGTINSRVVAEYKEFPGFPPIISGIRTVLSIIDKDRFLSGDKMLELTVSGGGTVFSAKLGDSGIPVDVSGEGYYLLIDPSDNTWIKVYRENELMVDGVYRNTISYTSFQDITELPISLVFWKGTQLEWGYSAAQRWVDLRSYGSFSINNEKYLDLANTISVEFDENLYGGFTVFEGSSLALTVNPFKIKYRGTLYRRSAPATLAIPDDFNGYLCASFDTLQGMSLSVVPSSTFELVPDRVVIAKVVSDAVEITEVSETFFPGSYNMADKFYEFNVSSEEDFVYALQTIKVLEGVPGVSSFVINIRENIVVNAPSILSGTAVINSPLVIDGHFKNVSFVGEINLSFRNITLLRDAFIETDGIAFSSDGVDSFVTFQNLVIQGSGPFGEFHSQVDFNACFMGSFRVASRVNITGCRLFESIILIDSATQINISKTAFNGPVPMIYCESYIVLLDPLHPTDLNALQITLDQCRVFGDGSLIQVAPGCPEGAIKLNLFNSRVKFGSGLGPASICDLTGHRVQVNLQNGALRNCVFIVTNDAIFRSSFNAEGTVLSGVFGFKYADTPTSWDDAVLISLKGVNSLGVLDITDFTSFVVESNSAFLNGDVLLNPVRSVFVEVVGQFPHPLFMENTWGSGGIPVNAFITCRGSLIRESFFYFYDADPDAFEVDLNHFFKVLCHSDHTIHIQGDYSGSLDKGLEIFGVAGSGVIELALPNLELGKLWVVDSIPFVATEKVYLQLQQPYLQALLVDNSFVVLNESHLSIVSGFSATWESPCRIVKVRNNSFCHLEDTVVAGSPGAGGNSLPHLITVEGLSLLKLNGADFSAAVSGVDVLDPISYIHAEEGSKVVYEGVVSFDTNISGSLTSLYSIDLMSPTYDYEHTWGMHNTDLRDTIAIVLNKVKAINGTITVVPVESDVTGTVDIDMRNVTGKGSLTFSAGLGGGTNRFVVGEGFKAWFIDFGPLLGFQFVKVVSMAVDGGSLHIGSVPQFVCGVLEFDSAYVSPAHFGFVILDSKGTIERYAFLGDSPTDISKEAFYCAGLNRITIKQVACPNIAVGGSPVITMGTLRGEGYYIIAEASEDKGTAGYIHFKAPIEDDPNLPGIYIRREFSTLSWETVNTGDSSGDLRVT